MSAIGLRVGQYEIVGRTHVPEPGDWHLARRTGSSRSRGPSEVLVRLLPPDASPDDREALHHQYEVLRALEDPRVPEVVAFYEGLGAMALSAVHGASLEDVVKAREGDVVVMSPSTLLDVVLELGETLQRAHHRNRFHGDLSPDRVLLAPDGRLWVFGFGQPLGTTPHPDWIAPEVRDGKAPTAATDQWYLGVLAAALVGGGSPWGSGLEALLAPAERQWPALGRLLARMTEPDPDDRYPSMHPVRQELLALARKAGGVSGRRELGGDMARPRALEAPRDDEPVRVPTPTPAPEEREAPPPPELPPDGFAPPGEVKLPSEPDVPTPDVEVDLTISEEYDVPPERPRAPPPPVPGPAHEGRTPMPASRLPDESFVVVRPDVGAEVPTATVQDKPGFGHQRPQGLGAPLPEPEADDALVAGVVLEETDPDAVEAFPPPSEAEPVRPVDPSATGIAAAPSPPPAPPPVPAPPEYDMNDIPSSAFPEPGLPPAAANVPVEPNPFATDIGADLAADAADAPGIGEGRTWDDLAREFATEAGAGDTILPPNADSLQGDLEPSAETEQSEPLIAAIAGTARSGPGADASLGIGPIDDDDPRIQGFDDDAPVAQPARDVVPTTTLVTRIAPVAVGLFVLLWVVWLAMKLLG